MDRHTSTLPAATRHSLHNGVRLIPCSPAIGLCVTVPAQREALSRVHASVEALRPRGFVVHLGIARQSIPKRPSHPASNVS
jgi:hypothetical protein